MNNLKKKILSLILSITIMITMFNQISISYFYAQEKGEKKWISKFEIIEISKEENKIKVEIGYNNLYESEKNEKLEGINFYIEDKQNKKKLELTEESILKLNKSLENYGDIQLDIDISQVDFTQFTNPNLRIVPIIKKEIQLDITDLMNYKNKSLSIILQDEEYREFESSYNNTTDLKKQEIKNIITKGQQVLDKNTFKLELEKYIQEKVYETLEQDEINQNIYEIIKKKKSQEEKNNENIIIEIEEIKSLQNQLNEKINKIKIEKLTILNNLALDKEINLKNENINEIKSNEQEDQEEENLKEYTIVNKENNHIKELSDDLNSKENDDMDNSNIIENIKENNYEIKESVKDNPIENKLQDKDTDKLEFKQLETISSLNINKHKLNSEETSATNTVTAFEKTEDENSGIAKPISLTADNKDIEFVINKVDKDAVYSNKTLSFEINISSKNLSSNINDPYIDVTVPNEYLLKNTLHSRNKETDAKIYRKKEELIETQDKTKTVLRIYINTIKGNSDTRIKLPVDLNLKPRITPNGYSVAPKIELFDSSGRLIKTHNEDKSIYISIKYEKPKLFKSISRQENTSKKYTSNEPIKGIDAHIVYGGKFKNDTEIIDETKAEDIEFYYSLSTVAKIQNPETAKENQDNRIPESGYRKGYEVKSVFQYSSGKNEVPTYKKIIIKDILPTYTGYNGQTYTAKFEQDKNPGWIYDQNEGTVSYTVDSKGKLSAEEVLHNEVKLILSFPNSKGVKPDSKGEYNLKDATLQNYVIKNTAEAELYPINGDLTTTIPTKIKDDLQFILNGSLLSGRGIFSKNIATAQMRKIKVDKNAMHLYTNDYRVTLANPYDRPMKNIVITEEDFDSRYFVKNIFWDIKNVPKEIIDGFDGVYGITQDNKEVKIIDKDNEEEFAKLTERQNPIISTINPDIQDKILENVKKLRENEILKKDIEEIQPIYKSIKFKMKDNFELNKNQLISFIVQMGFISPYTLEVDSNIGENTKNNLHNKAKLNVNMSDIPYEIVSGDFAELGDGKFTPGIDLDPSGNDQNKSVGSKFEFNFSVDLKNMPRLSRYNNPYIVILLPRGLDLNNDEKRHGFAVLNDYDNESLSKLIEDEYKNSQGSSTNTINLKAIEVKNFDTAGNRALIYPLKDFDAYEATGKMLIKIPVTINSDSLTLSIASKDLAHNADANKAHIFFYADNLQDSMRDASIDNTDKRYKDDEFKIIDMLDKKGLRKHKEQTKLLTFEKTYKATTAAKTNSEKFIRLKDGDWKKNIDTDYEESFEYKLSVRNFSDNQNISNIMIYDVLPYSKDSKNSEFSNYMQSGVKANIGREDNTALFNFYYYIGKLNPSSNINEYIENDNLKLNPNDWTDKPANFKDVKAVLIKSTDKALVKSGQIQDFILDMKAPEYNGENLSEKKSINNYDISINKDAVNANNFSKINDVYNKIVKKTSKVIARYIVVDEDGKEVTNLDEKTKEIFEKATEIKIGKIGEEYKTNNKEFDKFEFVSLDETKGEEQGQFKEETQEVVYKYTMKRSKNSGNIPSNPQKHDDNPPVKDDKEEPPVKDDEEKDTPKDKEEEPDKNPEKEEPKNDKIDEDKDREVKDEDKKIEEPKKPPVENKLSNVPEIPKPEEKNDLPEPKEKEKIENPSENEVNDRPNVPHTDEGEDRSVVREIPKENPPKNVKFVPLRIVNMKDEDKKIVVIIVDENGIPLGKAVVDKENNSYEFVDDDRVPMGKAKIHDDNVLEILDEKVPLKLPKTGQKSDILFLLLGLELIILAFRLNNKK